MLTSLLLAPPILEAAVLTSAPHSFIIQSVHDYLLSTCSAAGTVVDVGNAEMNETHQVLTLTLHLSLINRVGEAVVTIS